MDIDTLLGSLTDEDIEKLKATAAQFMGGLPDSGLGKSPEEKSGDISAGFSPDMLSAVAKISGAMSRNDPRSDFIMALKPLLSPERGKKADDAVMMLKFIKIMEAVKGNGL